MSTPAPDDKKPEPLWPDESDTSIPTLDDSFDRRVTGDITARVLIKDLIIVAVGGFWWIINALTSMISRQEEGNPDHQKGEV